MSVAVSSPRFPVFACRIGFSFANTAILAYEIHRASPRRDSPSTRPFGSTSDTSTSSRTRARFLAISRFAAVGSVLRGKDRGKLWKDEISIRLWNSKRRRSEFETLAISSPLSAMISARSEDRPNFS